MDSKDKTIHLLRARLLYTWAKSSQEASPRMTRRQLLRLLDMPQWDQALIEAVVATMSEHMPCRLTSRDFVATPESRDDIKTVFDHWQSRIGKTRTKLTAQRRSQIRARLREGYKVDDLTGAIDGLMASDWHQGNSKDGRKWLGLEYALRNGATVEKWRDATASPTQSAYDEIVNEWGSDGNRNS